MSPQALGNLQEAPLQPVIWPRGESRGRGMDTVTIGSPKFPSLATGRVKCTPMGVGWGGQVNISSTFILEALFLRDPREASSLVDCLWRILKPQEPQ